MTSGTSDCDGTFDIVHAHQVLQHVSDPVGAMAAMAELAEPGGVLAARDSDYSGFIWSPSDANLDRWRDIYLAVSRHNGAEPDAGRWLKGWARAGRMVRCDLRDVNVDILGCGRANVVVGTLG